MSAEAIPGREIHALQGQDALRFLQGLTSNDVLPLATAPGIVWTALLTPQGKYLADFFLARTEDGQLLLDIASTLAADTLRRLSLYRLRADVRIVPSPLHVQRGLGPTPAGACADPRHPALGWRAYRAGPGETPSIDWDAIRVEHLIPESGIELQPDETYILEAGFERLHGVDFKKGCYVGQEVTARMKHKTELRRGLVRLAVDRIVPVGSDIFANGKPVGRLFTQSRGRGLALIRLDLSSQAQLADGTSLTPA